MSSPTAKRLADVRRLYCILDRLSGRLGGATALGECSGRGPWPKRGVYFFFEAGETRRDSGDGPRVVRVGTHALKRGSRSTLWGRLSQHRGTASNGGGSHRGSVFRLHVGTALATRDPFYRVDSWGAGATAKGAVRESERPLEKAVSDVIGRMRVLWLDIDDPPGPESERSFIERNCIALLSNVERAPVDPSSPGWLGQFCRAPQVRQSGLWNVNHSGEDYEPAFLGRLERLVTRK